MVADKREEAWGWQLGIHGCYYSQVWEERSKHGCCQSGGLEVIDWYEQSLSKHASS